MLGTGVYGSRFRNGGIEWNQVVYELVFETCETLVVLVVLDMICCILSLYIQIYVKLRTI